VPEGLVTTGADGRALVTRPVPKHFPQCAQRLSRGTDRGGSARNCSKVREDTRADR